MTRHHNRSFAQVVALALVAAAFGVATGASAFPVSSQAPCGTFAGPGWKMTSMDGTRKAGTTWNVVARRVACSYAKATAKSLVETPFKGEARTKLKSPKGWTCRAGGGNSVSGRGTPGYCEQGSKSFSWGPATAP